MDRAKDTQKPIILYVDDELFNLTTFTAALRRHYKILTASSAREAIELLGANTVALIITDQRMPEMTGVQFLEAVIPEYPEPVRMILTGYSDIDAITNAINTGSVLRYITKPWNEPELRQIIDMGIKIHQLEKNSNKLLKNLEDELKNQKKTLELFRKYVPENIIKQAMHTERQQIFTEGEYRIISTLFSDIREFTRLSEQLEPKVLVNYLNEYFSVMVDCVIKNRGAIYKLAGDGLWAIFGWPVSAIYNQRNAVFCALDMIDALHAFNCSYGRQINYQTVIGIGIGTGDAVVGQIQTENFSSYTVIGESVDAAASIEQVTHSMPDAVLISEVTYQAVKNDIEVEKLSDNLYRVIKRK